MTTLLPLNEEIMTLFCTDNMTNNIQYGVTSHYSSMSGGATAMSLVGMVIGMGFTIYAYPTFHNGGGSQGWIRNCVKGVEPWGLGNFGPHYGLVQIPGRGSEDEVP